MFALVAEAVCDLFNVLTFWIVLTVDIPCGALRAANARYNLQNKRHDEGVEEMKEEGVLVVRRR